MANEYYIIIALHIPTPQLLRRSRRRTVGRYASAGKRFCDLDLRTHDLEYL